MSLPKAWTAIALYLASAFLLPSPVGAQATGVPAPGVQATGIPESYGDSSVDSGPIYKPYDRLPTSGYFGPDNFTRPLSNTNDEDIFDEGSPFRVSWSPPVDNARLFLALVYNTDENDIGAGNYTEIINVQDDSFADWIVNCIPRCGSPFVFAISNSSADSDIHTVLWSRLFWIRPISEQETFSSTVSTSKSTPTTSSSQETIGTSSTSDSTTTPSSSMTTMTSARNSFAPSATSNQPSSSVPSISSLADETGTPASSQKSSSAAAIGGGVGGGVGGLLLLVGAFFLWRKYHNKAGIPKDIQQYPEMQSL